MVEFDRRKATQRVGYFFAAICAIVLLFWILPVLVAYNFQNAAKRLSKLPGISAEGGWKAGAMMAFYHLAAIFALATIIVAGTGLTFADGGDDPGVEGDANGEADGPDENETVENGEADDPDENETDEVEEDEGLADTVVELAAYEVVVQEDTELDAGELVVNDSLGETVETYDFVRGHEVRLENLTPGETYTATIHEPADGIWPPEEVRFDPAEEDELLNVTVGYYLLGNESYEYLYLNQNTAESETRQINYTGHGINAINGERWVRGGEIFQLESGSDAFSESYYNPFEDQSYWTNDARSHWHKSNGSLDLDYTPYTYAQFGLFVADDREYVETLTLEGSLVNQTVVEEVEPHDFDVGAYEWVMSGASDAIRYHEGKTVDKYRLDARNEDEYAYVDPETGHILQWRGVWVEDGEDGKMDFVYDFFNYGEHDELEEFDPDEMDIQD